MTNTKPFTKNKYNVNNKLVIYGASVYGELARAALELLGIVPDFYCDKSEKRKVYFSTPVIVPKELKEFTNVSIIIASADFFYEIRDMLSAMGFTDLYDMSLLLKMELDVTKLSNRAREMYENKDYYINIASSQTGKKIVLNRIQYVVTEKCSLRCKDCSHLMPYYQHPQDIDIVKNKIAFDLLLDHVDYVAELRILGGEPFVNKEIYKLIEAYFDNSKIQTISIYTNGTIVPSEKVLTALKHENVKVHISDYKINHDKIEKLVKIFEEYSINYFVRSYDEWQDAGDTSCRGYSLEQIKKHFSTCFERNGYTFLHGKLYRCPRSAHGMNLGAMPDTPENYVDLQNWNGSSEKLRENIIALQNLKWLEACKYCSGPDNHEKGIPAAIQIKAPIEYAKIR